MLRTPLCNLLGIETPILVAPMGFVTGVELAAAVSNAGGLGILSFSGNPPEALREEIRRLRGLTDKPFGVNVLLPRAGAEHVTVCLEEKVPLLSLFWGDPSPYVQAAHATGVRVIDQVGSVAAARRSAAAGVDIIIAQGVEAGGHVAGEVASLALIPRVVDAIAPTPVVAAGGIADARGLVAALALGAQAVSIGTRFLATPEARAHSAYKQKVIEATEEDTVRTTLYGYHWPRAPHRVLRTPFVTQWMGQEERGQQSRPDEPIVGETVIAGRRVPMPRFLGFTPSIDTTGDIGSMAHYAGQGVGLVNEMQPAAAIVGEMVAGARRIIASLKSE